MRSGWILLTLAAGCAVDDPVGVPVLPGQGPDDRCGQIQPLPFDQLAPEAHLCVGRLVASAPVDVAGRIEATSEIAVSDRLRADALIAPRLRSGADVDLRQGHVAGRLGGPTAGELAGDGAVRVTEDLVALGSVRAAQLQVGGTLYLWEGVEPVVAGSASVGALQRVEADRLIPPESGCFGPAQAAAIDRAVAEVPTSAAEVSEHDALTLGCGLHRYGSLGARALDVRLTGDARLTVSGPVELGSLTVSGPHRLELVVSGRLRVDAWTVEDAEVWVVAPGEVGLGTVATIRGALRLVAPAATLTTPTGYRFRGSVLAADIDTAGPLELR